MTLRIGFLGAGLIGGYHAWSLGESGADADIVVVHDPDPARAAAFATRFSASVAVDVASAFRGVDAVYVCTWTAAHPELVARAAGLGLAVFCEKPLAVDLATARAMTEAVEAAGITHQVGLVLRSTPGFALLRALVADPRAGRLMSVVFRDDQEIPLGGYYGSDWRGDSARAGSGTLLEHSIHDLDLLEWIGGPLVSVAARHANFHGHRGIEDSVAVSFAYQGGGTGVLTSVWHDIPGRLSSRRVEIFTERCRIVAEGNAAEDISWELRAGEVERRVGPAIDEELRVRGVPVPENADGAFVAAALAKESASPSFHAALRAHELADAVYRSARAEGAAVPTSPR